MSALFVFLYMYHWSEEHGKVSTMRSVVLGTRGPKSEAVAAFGAAIMSSWGSSAIA
jgi:hypothetical protein